MGVRLHRGGKVHRIKSAHETVCGARRQLAPPWEEVTERIDCVSCKQTRPGRKKTVAPKAKAR